MNKFIMMIGLPASGKDTWIKKFLKASNESWTVLSSDEIRKELYGDEAEQGNPTEVFNKLNLKLKYALIHGDNIIYNATNIKVKDRRPALEIVKKYNDYMVYAIIMATTLPQCYQNDMKRERHVPREVIKRMYYNFEPPHYFEGFNRIEVEYPFIKPYILYKDKIKELKKISHDNPHHKLSLGSHINAAVKLFKKDKKNLTFYHKDYPLEDYYKNVVEKALMFHDIAKDKTKVFNDAKGNPTDIAHYYHHENVGAYDYMFYLLENDYYDPMNPEYDPNVAVAIAYHMRPFSWNSEKTYDKYLKLWGDKLFRVVELVHCYDELSEK